MLVFFTDAIKINLGQLRQQLDPARTCARTGRDADDSAHRAGALGSHSISPGRSTFLIAAILASTDAVLLRDVLNNRHVPRSVRHTLSIEAGTNDVIVLPLVLVLIVDRDRRIAATRGDWVEFALSISTCLAR